MIPKWPENACSVCKRERLIEQEGNRFGRTDRRGDGRLDCEASRRLKQRSASDLSQTMNLTIRNGTGRAMADEVHSPVSAFFGATPTKKTVDKSTPNCLTGLGTYIVVSIPLVQVRVRVSRRVVVVDSDSDPRVDS